MSFIKRHWFLISLLVLFLFAVYTTNLALAKIAGILLAAAALILSLFSPISWLIRVVMLLVGAYALNFTYGFFPPADTWYKWLPRQKQGPSDFSLRTPTLE